MDAIIAGLPDAIDRGAGKVTEAVKDVRDPLTPVDTGGLLASGRIVHKGQGEWEFREGDGLPDARAIYTEYGTRKMAAQPHVTPAVEQVRPRAAAIAAPEIRKLTR